MVLISYVTLDNLLICAEVTPVTPSRIFSSTAVEVTVANLLISAPVAVIGTVPRVIVLASKAPLTVNLLVDKVSKSAVVL